MNIKELAERYAKSDNVSNEYGYKDHGAVARKRLAEAVLALLEDSERLVQRMTATPLHTAGDRRAECKTCQLIDQHRALQEKL